MASRTSAMVREETAVAAGVVPRQCRPDAPAVASEAARRPNMGASRSTTRSATSFACSQCSRWQPCGNLWLTCSMTGSGEKIQKIVDRTDIRWSCRRTRAGSVIIVLIFCRTTGSASDRLMAPLQLFAHLTPVGAEHFGNLVEVFLRPGNTGRYRPLNRRASSRVSSRCGNWSFPPGQVRLVEKNVRGLQEWVEAEKPIGAGGPVFDFFLFFLVGRIPLHKTRGSSLKTAGAAPRGPGPAIE